MKTVRAWWIPAEDGGPEREYFWPYLNRETGIRLYYGGDQASVQLSRIDDGENAIVFIDSSVNSYDFLEQFPTRSVVVFFVSDETYSAWATIRLLLKPSTLKVFRDYPIGNFSNLTHYPALLIQAIREEITVKLPTKVFLRAFVSGIGILVKQVLMAIFSILTRKKLDWLPLGYTGSFSKIYAESFNLGKNVSILEYSIAVNFNNVKLKKKTKTFFSGQIGGFDRQAMINMAKLNGLFVGPLYPQFGGPSNSSLKKKAESEYFLGLSGSKFSICPPGNYSAESFRYLESLILYSYPLLKTRVLSDPLSNLNDAMSFEHYLSHGESIREESMELEIRKKLLDIRDKLLRIRGELTFLS
jgi:hypothetical protein